MHIEFLVEEASTEIALKEIVPKIIGNVHTFKIHNFQNKDRLLKRLPERMKAYANFIHDDWRIVVLVDEDRSDCQELKKKLCHASSIVTQKKGNIVLHRIVVEELESWFIGDVAAIRAEYEKIPVSLSQQAKFRNPDAIKGGTWEELDKILKKYGYETGLQKMDFAQKVSPHMDVENNQSRSFQVFRDGLRRMIS
ncbi:MAG: DUF4276 family protein [Dolichospermum sp. JUN01]|jgi:hypothetical protein|nr:DUF4276 family protein [Dolichospermum sp.]MBO1059116.1 DUF4276 family protein [Dolichospermum sp. JUN01]MBS9383532.1 DUF4276 family protein [Dolichospermum sp. BR01]MBS9387952.1 DUF4276 family protein [Dolichospermum sp. WA123]MBS9392967.1 DUF4276 family protein [Dolichospermum sp. OL01]MCO5796602.1 DUF4276 family protein [Dolichospermum sp. OL03]QSV58202.1 MAG: DUF4276 family protein [Dolichospermum sp. LBC05a]